MPTEETIFKRKDGRWVGSNIRGFDTSGKVSYDARCGKKNKEVKEKVTKCKLLVKPGKQLSDRKEQQIFACYCDQWLHTGKSHLKESTYVKYTGIVEKHIKPELGGVAPLHMNTALICAFTEKLRESGLAPKTVKDILVVLRSILKFTAGHFPEGFPVIDIRYPKDSNSQMRVLTRAEQERFVRYLLKDMDSCKFGVLLALNTGMRIGEICALRWENISLAEQTIFVGATMQRLQDLESKEKKTKILISTPKSDKSLRTIPMTSQLAALCAKIGPGKPNTYVLTGSEKFMEPRVLQYKLEKYTQECSLKGVHFHTLRHTFATRCVEVGFEIKSLSEILGHATTTITLDRYVHASMELKRENMNKLSSAGFEYSAK